jgi:hypothetical protein
VDFNYIEGKDARLNKSHPALRSPVDGIVENAGQGDVGRIAIRDKNGFLHEILHTDARHVTIGGPVAAGQLIGTMGNTGVDHKNPKEGANHVHYQLRDPAGNVINPTKFWDRQGPADPNPSPPAYLGEYQQYLRGLDTNSTPAAPPPASSVSFADRFTKWGSVPQGNGSPAASDAPATFDNRFGNWGSFPSGGFGDTSSPVLRALERNRRSAVPCGFAPASAQGASSVLPTFQPADTGTGGVLGKYFDASVMPPAQGVSPSSPSFADSTAPDFPAGETGSVDDMPVRILSRRVLNPSPTAVPDDRVPAAPSPQANRPLGIFSGKPMPNYPVPPPIWGLPDDSRAKCGKSVGFTGYWQAHIPA